MDWKYTSEETNKLIREYDCPEDPDIEVHGGKEIFYWGWYWRDVDFDKDQYWLAINIDPWVTPLEIVEGGLTGFCESNKWGYKEFKISKDNTIKLRTMIENYLSNRTQGTADEIFKFMQYLGAQYVESLNKGQTNGNS